MSVRPSVVCHSILPLTRISRVHNIFPRNRGRTGVMIVFQSTYPQKNLWKFPRNPHTHTTVLSFIVIDDIAIGKGLVSYTLDRHFNRPIYDVKISILLSVIK